MELSSSGSRCKCTSIAGSDSTLPPNSAMRLSLRSVLFVEVPKGLAGLGKLAKQGTHLPPLPEFLIEGRNAFDDSLQANRVCVEHGTTPPARKPIPVHVYDIDV